MKLSLAKFFRVFLAFVFVIGLTGGLVVVRRAAIRVADFKINTVTGSTTVEIPNGATGDQIALMLFEKKIVASSEIFYRLAVADPRAATIAPGSHTVDLHIPARLALEQLLDPKRMPNLVIVKEGAWRSEILQSMVVRGFKASKVKQALSRLSIPSGFSRDEGIYFPAQYSFARGTSELTALQSMVDRFVSEGKASGLFNIRGKFSPAQLLTIASIAQAEGDTKDFPKIARVIFNRLAIGMPLQMDTTVHYIKKSRGRIFSVLVQRK
jgi:UPF0755 protein